MNNMAQKGFTYSIHNFIPPAEHSSMGGFGFSTSIDPQLARKALETELPENYRERLLEIGKGIIMGTHLARDDFLIHPPYSFVEQDDKYTCLLHSCDVPGDACSLSVSWEDINSLKKGRNSFFGITSRGLPYHPHNVDTSKQAYGLLSLWLRWAHSLDVFLKEKE